MSLFKSEGQASFEKAEKKAVSSPGWFTSEAAIHNEAAQLYRKAANELKYEKSLSDAATAFSREAECWEKCNERFDAANAWRNAAIIYRELGELDREFNVPYI